MKSLPFLLALIFAGLSPLARAGDSIDAADLDALRAAAGTDVSVTGNVVDVGTTKEGGITFINIGMPKKKGFVAVIFKSNYGSFPDGFDKYRNQNVTVTGALELYKSEQPQVVLRSPEQIKINTP